MFIVESYSVAVFLCFITMLCWGSWANTQKLASKEWPFQLFYWDYCHRRRGAVSDLRLHAGSVRAMRAGRSSPTSDRPVGRRSGRPCSAASSSTWPTSCWWLPSTSRAWRWRSRSGSAWRW